MSMAGWWQEEVQTRVQNFTQRPRSSGGSCEFCLGKHFPKLTLSSVRCNTLCWFRKEGGGEDPLKQKHGQKKRQVGITLGREKKKTLELA